MRIAVVHNLAKGGAWRRVQNQIGHLEGVLLEFCLQSATPITPNAVQIPFSRRAESLPAALRPAVRYTDQLRLEAAWRRLASAVNGWNPDVLYINPCRYLQTPPLPYVTLAPAVYYCDEPRRVDYEPLANAQRNPATRALYGPLYRRERELDRRAVSGLALIATNSRYTARAIERAYGRDATVVYPGVSPELVSHTPAQTHGFVLSVGTLLPSKGHDLVLEAVARTKARLPVTIVAPRPAPAYEQELSAMAGRLGVELTIEIAVSDDRLAHLYSTAAVTVYLARQEPFGMVSIEAQANGCPVLVAADGGLPETIVDGETGFACPTDPEVAAALLDRMLDPGWRGAATGACRRQAARFTWDQAGADLQRLLEQAAASSHDRRSH